MAAISPTDIFSGYSADATAITIPLAALSGLTQAEAHATTGDAREVLRIILETYVAAIEGMASGDRPVSMTLARGNLIGLTNSTVRRSYSASFEEAVGPTATTLKAEPV